MLLPCCNTELANNGGRKTSDLILLYKVVNSLEAVPVNYLPPRSQRYADCIRFIAYHCRVNVYQHSFFPRIVIPWNRLPDSLSSPYTGCKVLRNCTVYINSIHHGWSVEIGKSQPEGLSVPGGNKARRVSHWNDGPEG